MLFLHALLFLSLAIGAEWLRVQGTGDGFDTWRLSFDSVKAGVTPIDIVTQLQEITAKDISTYVLNDIVPLTRAGFLTLQQKATANPVDTLKTVLFYYVIYVYCLSTYRHLRARGLYQSLWHGIQEGIKCTLALFLSLPPARARVEAELTKVREEMETKFLLQAKDIARHLELPQHGRSIEWIVNEMERIDEEAANEHKGIDWREGKLSGAVYHGGDDLTRVVVAAFERYAVSNPLHPDVFPAIRKMEAEIVAMCLALFGNPAGAGTMTSGGTESILMAIKTHRDWARAVKGIIHPEMILPITAHAAFDKGSAYMNVKVHTIPVHPLTRRVDIRRVRKAINPNTIMLVGSAINFPDGNQDDIVALGKLASKYGIGLHVDCCLGSFILPFLEPAGLANGEVGAGGVVKYKLELFDFRVKGVTSISCDTHKYGFAPKGTSVVMYRSAALRRFQYYVNPNWTGGVYASPSISGSRPGSLIAGTWAAMQYMGSSGYLASCHGIVTCARKIANAITSSVPELYVLGSPPASVVAVASRDPIVDVYEVGDAMGRRGWHLNAITNPRGLHIACTMLTLSAVDTFVEDLKACVEEARKAPNGKGTMVTLYGLGSSSPVGPTLVGEVASIFLDMLYKA